MNNLMDRIFFYFNSYEQKQKVNDKKLPFLVDFFSSELEKIGYKNLFVSHSENEFIFDIPENMDYFVSTLVLFVKLDKEFLMTKPKIQIFPHIKENLFSSTEINLHLKDLNGKMLVLENFTFRKQLEIIELIEFLSKLKSNNITHGKIKIVFSTEKHLDNGINSNHFDNSFAISFENIQFGSLGVLDEHLFKGNILIEKQTKNVDIDCETVKKILIEETNCKVSKIDENNIHFLFSGLNNKQKFNKIENKLNQDFYGKLKCEIKIEPFNSASLDKKQKIKDFLQISKLALYSHFIEPKLNLIRDFYSLNAKLTQKGIPCISISNGYYAINAQKKYILIDEVEKTVLILCKIAQFIAESEKFKKTG